MLLEKIEELLKEVDSLTAQNAEEVEQLRIKYLSKKGEINALMADFRNVPGDQKKEVGIKINELKHAIISSDGRYGEVYGQVVLGSYPWFRPSCRYW